MENAEEFEKRLSNLLKEGKEKLEMNDGTIAWILLREGTSHYFRDLGKCGRCQLKGGHDGK